jgi:pimeloyl-ACP methyl ester carboxylesterase
VTDATTDATTGQYPVLIIPGYGAPQIQSDLVGRHLQAGGLDTVNIKLPWMAMGDMTKSADILAEQVRRLRETLGYEKVNLFGYSLGGIIARYYLQVLEGHPALGRGAFVSSPNAGTYFGYVGFFSPAGRQVRPSSPLIQHLNQLPLPESIAGKCLSIYVRWDGVIVPFASAYMSYGYNIVRQRPVSHWRAVMSREIVGCASEFLRGEMPEDACPGHEIGILEPGGVFAVPVAFDEGGRRTAWQTVARPFKSLGGRIASLFRR